MNFNTSYILHWFLNRFSRFHSPSDPLICPVHWDHFCWITFLPIAPKLPCQINQWVLILLIHLSVWLCLHSLILLPRYNIFNGHKTNLLHKQCVFFLFWEVFHSQWILLNLKVSLYRELTLTLQSHKSLDVFRYACRGGAPSKCLTRRYQPQWGQSTEVRPLLLQSKHGLCEDMWKSKPTNWFHNNRSFFHFQGCSQIFKANTSYVHVCTTMLHAMYMLQR